mmetsp:Transcript_4429/g.7418  ORF Transcript_4429/g.7418 Transcript_4429/m.7418 type:complete len:111 (+) Transcript_4429:177-509(+)
MILYLPINAARYAKLPQHAASAQGAATDLISAVSPEAALAVVLSMALRATEQTCRRREKACAAAVNFCGDRSPSGEATSNVCSQETPVRFGVRFTHLPSAVSFQQCRMAI